MTIGIIQQWADRYHNERLTLMIINELIEKIKQEFKTKEFNSMDFSNWKQGYNDAIIDCLKNLIGDN